MVQKYHSPGAPQGRQYPARRQRHWFAQDLSFGLDHCEKSCLSSRLGCLFIEHCKLGWRSETPLMQVKAPPD